MLSREIDARVRTERELSKSRSKLQAIVDTAVDGIITMDQKGVIVFINKAGEAMFGYAPDALLGQN